MAMTQTAFKTRQALNRGRTVAASRSQRAEMPLFQAFLRPSSAKVTDGLCIKDTTTIDPACGSGNFLTETYISLRRLENEVLQLLTHGQIRWDSEACLKAHVHCVIIGFSYAVSAKKPHLYLNDTQDKEAENINPYLVDAPSILIENRSKSICDVPPIIYGSMPIDDGHLILDKEDVDTLLAERKENQQFIRKYAGGAELIRNKVRWCLWLYGISPKEIQKSAFVMQRIKQTAEFRKSSSRPQTLALAETPTIFGEIRQPKTDMLVIPKVSSENRRYIPICYVSPQIIVNGSALIVPDAEMYHFGVLISNVHMSWMRTVEGRMKSDYRYSGKIVYNNFPWPEPTEEQRRKIEQTARAILDARSIYKDCTLAELYDELAMPPELRKAHQQNDKAVMRAYGFSIKDTTESSCVAALMKLYQQKTKNHII